MQTNRYFWIVAIILLAGGFIAGYAMSRGSSAPTQQADIGLQSSFSPAAKSLTAQSQSTEGSTGIAAVVHRFPLSAADVKEGMESAAVAVTDNGAVHVAWASRVSDDQWQVFLTSSTDRGETFDVPRVVAASDVHRVTSQSRGKTISREVRMMPRLVSRGNELLLSWVEAVEDNTAVKYFVARSIDGGKTFAAPIVASLTDGARPTYTALAVSGDGRIAASWLDNRNKVQLPAAAVSSSEGQFRRDELAYAPESGTGVCPCCPTNLAFGPDGSLYLAFRNQQNGFRDVWVSRQTPGQPGFEQPKPVVSPTWQFDGCPHDGPSLAVHDDRLHVAWMDARSGQPRVYLARGNLDVENFDSQEADSASAHSQGHPSLVSQNHTLHLTWDEGSGATVHSTEGKPAADEKQSHTAHSHADQPRGAPGESFRSIRYAAFSPDGKPLSEPIPVAPAAGSFQTRPSLAVHSSGEVYVGWVELSAEGKAIAIARLNREPSAPAMVQDGAR